jgi:hypothetical protein
VLNPLAYIDEAKAEALKPFSGVKSSKTAEDNPASQKLNPGQVPSQLGPVQADQQPQDRKPQITGAMILKAADQNGDGVLTVDEFGEHDRPNFANVDLDKNGQVDEAELDAEIKKKLSEAK